MLLKTLFTLVVILGVVLFLRGARLSRTSLPIHGAIPAPRRRDRRFIRLAAAAAVTIMLAGAASAIYLQWEREREVVHIRVINSSTGGVTHYRARRSEIDPEAGRFRTLDGEEVRAAAVERMEVGGAEAGEGR